jgi:hypothetical protein
MAGVFLDDTPSDEPAAIPAEVKVPESARARLTADDRGLVFIGDMAFNLDRLNRLGFNGRKWPKGILPVSFHENVSAFNQQRFYAACLEWSKAAAVRCVPRSNEANYVQVHSGAGNWSLVGMQGGMQQMEIANWEMKMTIAHEIAHALGAGHEQSRQDRDQYVTIVREVIQPGREGNFRKLPLKAPTAYDFESVMHYPPDAFSTTGASTIVPKPGFEHYAAIMGNRQYLSQGDRESMRSQYGAPNGVMPLGDAPVTSAAPAPAEELVSRARGSMQAAPAPIPTMPSIADDDRTKGNAEGAEIRVVGGIPVAPGTFPDTVGITAELSSGVQCTGTLIQPDVVLTAAHCVCADVSGNVYLGDDPRRGGRFVAVKKAEHGLRNCSSSLKDGLDLALLLLESPVTGIRPRPIADDARVNTARSYRVVGFGATDFDAEVFPEEKREALVISTSNDCRGSTKAATDEVAYQCSPGNEIVAGRTGATTDTCQGDSGGPLLLGPIGTGVAPNETEYRLAGVTSRASSLNGRLCGDGGVYERLNEPARDWITKTLATMR